MQTPPSPRYTVFLCWAVLKKNNCWQRTCHIYADDQVPRPLLILAGRAPSVSAVTPKCSCDDRGGGWGGGGVQTSQHAARCRINKVDRKKKPRNEKTKQEVMSHRVPSSQRIRYFFLPIFPPHRRKTNH